MRNSHARFPWVLTASLLALVLGVTLALASGSEPKSTPRASGSPEAEPGQKSWQDLYDEGLELAKGEKYADALKIFEQVDVMQPKNPDVLNMLAYTQRKTGDIDSALENYGKALKIKPKFPQCREYLGEAYLQAALREAATLKSYGDDGSGELGKLSDAAQEAASQLESSRSKGGVKNVKW